MGLVDHTQSFQVPYSEEDTYAALKSAVSRLQGFQVDKINDMIKTIYLKAGVSLFSWGENITVNVEKAPQGGSVVSILSTPKTGIMFGGAMDMGKNRRNISAISEALSYELQRYAPVRADNGAEVSASGSSFSAAEEIQKLAQLKDQGVLTEEEFNQKKKQLLGL